jgi:hypothetical protein
LSDCLNYFWDEFSEILDIRKDGFVVFEDFFVFKGFDPVFEGLEIVWVFKGKIDLFLVFFLGVGESLPCVRKGVGGVWAT